MVPPRQAHVQNPPALVATGTAKAFYNPNEHIREDFGTLRADYNLCQGRHAFERLHDGRWIERGPARRSAVCIAYTIANAQVLSLTETHIFSPQILNTATVGFSRASFALGSVLLTTFPADVSFVSGLGPGGIIVGGGATTTASGSITSAGPNNAAGVSNHRNLFTYQDSIQISKGSHQITLGVWFQRLAGQ